MDAMELQRLCVEYQELLRIPEWRITTKVVGKDDLPEDVVGYADFQAQNKTALIKIAKEEDYDPAKWMVPYDDELILVHEVLHLLYCSVDKEDCDEYEFAIEATAEALVNLRRLNGAY